MVMRMSQDLSPVHTKVAGIPWPTRRLSSPVGCTAAGTQHRKPTGQPEQPTSPTTRNNDNQMNRIIKTAAIAAIAAIGVIGTAGAASAATTDANGVVTVSKGEIMAQF